MRHDLRSRLHHTKPSLWAALTLAAAVAATSAVAIANAEGGGHNARPDKAKSCSSSSACFQETNTSSGVAIEGNASNNAGVSGSSTSYYGVLGQSSGSFAGVGGYNYDAASGASGVYGQSENGPGVYGFSQSDYAVVAAGNAYVSGLIFTGGACQDGCSKTRKMLSFVPRASQPTIDDVGESTLHAGATRVALAHDFANAIDTQKPYVVLLTPEGDASLYVTNRTATGFDVREIGGGHSSVPFAYRIVAKPFAVADERLPFKTIKSASAVEGR
jgi:hypothetical protein